MKKLTTTCLLLCLSLHVLAQPEAEASLRPRADSLYQQAKTYFQQQDSVGLFRDLGKSLQIYVSLQDSAEISNTLNDYGFHYYFYGDFAQAIAYYQRALAIDRQMADTVRMIGRLYNIGGSYSKQGLSVPALEYLQQALELAEAIGRTKSLAMVSNSMANVLTNHLQYSEATAYFHQSLSHYRSLQDSLGASYVLNNLGRLYQDQQQYDSAAYYLQQALTYKQAVASERSVANTLTNLGKLSLQQGDHRQAETYLRPAFRTFCQEQDTYRQVWSANMLSQLYLQTGQYERARHYLNRVRQSLDSMEAREERLVYLENEAAWQEAQGKPTLALAYHRQWAALRDSLFHEDRLQVVQMQADYLMKQQEQARALAEQEKVLAQQEVLLARAEARQQRLITFGTAALLLIFVGLAALLYEQNRRIKAQNEEISRLSEHNAWLVREQHHRVKNHLQMLANMLSIQSHRLEEGHAQLVIQESQLRVQAISLIHRRLYGREFTRVAMRSYLEEVARNVIDAFGLPVVLELRIDEVQLDDRQAVPLGLIVNELVTNACKYGLPLAEDPRLLLRFWSDNGQDYQLLVHDNGPGVPELMNKSFGMELIELQTEQLYGKSRFERRDGLLFLLQFTKRPTA